MGVMWKGWTRTMQRSGPIGDDFIGERARLELVTMKGGMSSCNNGRQYHNGRHGGDYRYDEEDRLPMGRTAS